ncbi:MAG: ArsR family transcriptional regulator [Alphaproteobacteria bacterium]|nr:MAG: hypothetical protein B6I23_01660 [Rickettsiaceae bacterium 4572_127]
MYSINTNFNVIFKAISYKTRTDILKLISKQNNLCLMDLTEKLKMGKQTLEFHLKILKSAGLIISKRSKEKILLSCNKKQINSCFKEFTKFIN